MRVRRSASVCADVGAGAGKRSAEIPAKGAGSKVRLPHSAAWLGAALAGKERPRSSRSVTSWTWTQASPPGERGLASAKTLPAARGQPGVSCARHPSPSPL
jgi:hypothetical protein